MGTNAFGSTYGGKSNLNNFSSCDLDNILGFSSVRHNSISAEEEKKSVPLGAGRKLVAQKAKFGMQNEEPHEIGF